MVTINKVSHKLYILSKIRQFLTVKSAALIYKTIILPYFDYSEIIYMFSSNPELIKLERLHEQCINICTRTYGRDNTNNITLISFPYWKKEDNVILIISCIIETKM